METTKGPFDPELSSLQERGLSLRRSKSVPDLNKRYFSGASVTIANSTVEENEELAENGSVLKLLVPGLQHEIGDIKGELHQCQEEKDQQTLIAVDTEERVQFLEAMNERVQGRRDEKSGDLVTAQESRKLEDDKQTLQVCLDEQVPVVTEGSDAKVASLQERIADLEARLKGRNKYISKKNREIAEKNRELAEKNAAIERKNAELAQKNEEDQTLPTWFLAAHEKIDELKVKLAEEEEVSRILLGRIDRVG